MATNTTNLSLIKPAGTDKVRIAQINQNMDILDEKIGPVGNTSVQDQIIANDSGMAIVSTGNTHSAIASGEYVYIRSHGTLAEGMYKANSAISANATLSTSNVTRVSSGGMNDLKEQIDSLNSNKANKNAPISYFSLIDRVTLSKNATDYTFYNGRSLATYPTISIQPIIGGYFRQGVVIPRVHFNNPATGRFSLGYYSGGEQVEIVIAYVDDDKINMKYNATGTFTVEMIIDGLVNGSA